MRWQQFIEESYRQRLEEQQVAKEKNMFSAIGRHFDGQSRNLGGAIVMPALRASAANKVSIENKMLKQQRKAAETRLLLKEKPPKK